MNRPRPDEAAPYFFRYIDRVPDGDVVEALEQQLEGTLTLARSISEERSMHRYAAGKWSLRDVLNHVSDTERTFAFRALWFARGFAAPLPSFEQEPSAVAARADEVPWAEHMEEFRAVRRATLALLRHLPVDAWERGGTAGGNHFTVRAAAFIMAGHTAHHLAGIRELYLQPGY